MQDVGQGQQTLFDGSSDLNVLVFIINRLLARTATVKIVKVVSVTAGEGNLPGTVDVKPLVRQMDGAGNTSAHGTIYGLPYLRLQAGGNAVIMEPVVGDIGICVVADRDISAVKIKKNEAPPGSFRQFDVADGIYIGGILNGAPTGYFKFNADGTFKLVDKLGNTLETSATGFAVVTVPGGTFTVNGISATLHTHLSAAAGNPTGPPIV